MTKDQKVTWIQYFQYLHSQWCTKFAKNLSLAQCVDKAMKDNIIITNFIDLFYTYKPFELPITLAHTLEFNIILRDPDNTFNVDYILNNSTLVSFSGTKEQLLDYIVTELNLTGNIIAFVKEDIIYIYSYDNSYTLLDLPTVDITNISSGDTITVDITSLENNTSIILDSMNCLTYEEMCNIKNKLLILLKECNCD